MIKPTQIKYGVLFNDVYLCCSSLTVLFLRPELSRQNLIYIPQTIAKFSGALHETIGLPKLSIGITPQYCAVRKPKPDLNASIFRL